MLSAERLALGGVERKFVATPGWTLGRGPIAGVFSLRPSPRLSLRRRRPAHLEGSLDIFAIPEGAFPMGCLGLQRAWPGVNCPLIAPT